MATLALVAGGVACGDEGQGTAPGIAPPVVGDIAGTGAPTATAAPAGPRERSKLQVKQRPATADAPAGSAPASAKTPLSAAEAAAAVAAFEPKLYCLMPKLSTCSIYGAKYPRLDAVESFCGKLGGEKTTYCPTDQLVGRCLTTGNVLVHYYATGEAPYTKDSFKEKCVKAGSTVLE